MRCTRDNISSNGQLDPRHIYVHKKIKNRGREKVGVKEKEFSVKEGKERKEIFI
jgi:hypothetical protein